MKKFIALIAMIVGLCVYAPAAHATLSICPNQSTTRQSITTAVAGGQSLDWGLFGAGSPSQYSGHYTDKDVCTATSGGPYELLQGDSEWYLFSLYAKQAFLNYAGISAMPNTGADWYGTDWTYSDTGSGVSWFQYPRIVVYIRPGGYWPGHTNGVYCAFQGELVRNTNGLYIWDTAATACDQYS